MATLGNTFFRWSIASRAAGCYSCWRVSGANWIRPGSVKCRWRAVVGQQATQKADQNLTANNMALAA